jgi:hypothetical protein
MSELRLKATPMCKNLIVINGSASGISRRFSPAAARFASLQLRVAATASCSCSFSAAQSASGSAI